jgi:outer membrane protein assembly factor BamB
MDQRAKNRFLKGTIMTKLITGLVIVMLINFCVSPFETIAQGQTPPAPTPGAPTDPYQIVLPFVTKSTATTRPPSTGAPWPMVAANSERTSWSPEEVQGPLHAEWYRPIEAYISQNVQLIASDNKIFVATARGLYALNADNGNIEWRYNTELPLGNSPSVAAGVVYVAGYDRKLHALSVTNGAQLWEYAGALAGYDTNPLVVEGKVILGNRDGGLYAIGAAGTPNEGLLIWKFQAGGPIHTSPAYKEGVVYFAANDNYAYAVNVHTGDLVWKSARLPGEGYHSYWPVIYQDKVIFSTSPAYRTGIEPGTRSLVNLDGAPQDTFTSIQMDDLFPTEPDGTLLGPVLPAQVWSHGYQVISAGRVAEYLENNPATDPHKHKPWRRSVVILNRQDGSEYTFDSDRDGRPEYAPLVHWGTKSGSRYPPIVGQDGILYFNQLYQKTGDPQGKVMGWQFGTTNFSLVGGQASIVEPQAISGGGNLIYRSLCCDRLADAFSIERGYLPTATVWSYNLTDLAPGYDPMWTILPGWPRLKGWYKGNTASINGIYHNHGDQNPLIPYKGRLYIHRSNTVFAFGPGAQIGRLPLLGVQSAPSTSTPLTEADLQSRLEEQIRKMIEAGHLRPGYYNAGQFSLYKELADYFDNPGDTLYTLSIAYPHLSADLQSQLRAYLEQEYRSYFDPVMYAKTGWIDGAARESMPIPPDVQSSFSEFPKSETVYGFAWFYPPHNFYAMWKYVQHVAPAQAGRAYDLAKTKLQVPVPAIATADYFRERPYELNAFIAGYVGFLRLQELAGRTSQDAQLRTQVTNELNRLYQLRVSIFSKDTPYLDNYYHKRSLNIARNFMFMTPELGDYLNRNALAIMQTAFNEYNYIAPYWFVSRYESMSSEGVMSPLWNYPAMFQAKAYILKESRAELAKYLDAPAFERGDLFFIQNIVAALEAR